MLIQLIYSSSMHIPVELIGAIAGIVTIFSIVPYIISIFRGYAKPSRSAYAIWVVVELVTVSSYIASGARTTIWVMLVLASSAFFIFCLSIKYGMGGKSKLDIFCLILALLAITLWVTTKNPTLALYTSITAVMLGYIPVIRKAYYYPKTENTLSWAMVALASVVNLCALTSLEPEIALLPIAGVIVQTFVTILLVQAPGSKLLSFD